MVIDKVKQGKRNRANGAAFELRVRKDLEEKGWLVDKWGNNVEFLLQPQDLKQLNGERVSAKIIPAKRKWSGPGRPMAIGTGFPDFVCIKVHDLSMPATYHVQFVESKVNGKLDKIEKEKCKWLVEQGHIVIIASKTKVKNKIVIKYEDFFEKYGI